MLKKILYLVTILTSIVANAQYIPISEEAEISILTIGPGSELYDKFGHSSIRMYDPTRELDIVYNYGTFDWTTPNFYTKFARGKLLYQLSVDYYEPFFQRYVVEDRWVKEQVLSLTFEQKQELFNFLQNNARAENREYKYDFFFDNCATRIRDVLVEVLDNDLVYDTSFAQDKGSFRVLIQENVHWNSWGSLGMDVAIGAITDRTATAWEYQYLPGYLFEASALASVNTLNGTTPLIKSTTNLYDSKAPRTQTPTSFLISPLFVFGLCGLLILWITVTDFRSKKRSRYLDGVIFGVTGIVGIILALLWFATDHTATANNYNLLWAFPFSILFVAGIIKKVPKKWLGRYVVFLLLALILLTIHWISGVQSFPIPLLPLLIGLFVRYTYVARFLNRQHVNE